MEEAHENVLGRKVGIPHGKFRSYDLGDLAIQFQVYPLNFDEYNHETASDWARKEIAGAAMYREWVGENDETITLRGKLFPHFYARAARQREQGPVLPTPGTRGGIGSQPHSGLADIDVLNNMRLLGQAHPLVRGDGWHYGWFIIERMTRSHTKIAPDGIGQQIQFDAVFQRVPVPTDPDVFFSSLWGTLQPAAGG